MSLVKNITLLSLGSKCHPIPILCISINSIAIVEFPNWSQNCLGGYLGPLHEWGSLMACVHDHSTCVSVDCDSITIMTIVLNY